ncbi:MAG: hypothetical protein E7603_01255 [Ruminococcaceae bacterium]|nr:hypothetical protein [Oscillospiraceae bacterium]
MRKQLQGISLILVSILLMIVCGDSSVFDLDFDWSLIFSLSGIAGCVMTFLPDKKNQKDS